MKVVVGILVFSRALHVALSTNVVLSRRNDNAEMAELVDALASGASGGNPVEVRVLFSAPLIPFLTRQTLKTQGSPEFAFCASLYFGSIFPVLCPHDGLNWRV